jgi:hypothetical protein
LDRPIWILTFVSKRSESREPSSSTPGAEMFRVRRFAVGRSAAAIATASSVARTDMPSATMRVARASWASASASPSSARAWPAEMTPAATRVCTFTGSFINRMVFVTCERLRPILLASSSWVAPNSSSSCW